jgi:hypothetical protein
MNKRYLVLLFISIVFWSCNDDNQKQLDAQKIAQKNEAVFKNISKIWAFQFPDAVPEIQNKLRTWKDWTQFENEMRQKPKATLLAFRLKSKNIAIKSDTLAYSVPFEYNNPQVLSRIKAMNTKIKYLETFMNLQIIPEQKIAKLIPEINEEIAGIYKQWNEIIIKKAIPKEFGEELMLKAFDTTRNATPKLMLEQMKGDNPQIK